MNQSGIQSKTNRHVKHFTLTKVLQDENKSSRFGFAVADDDEKVFVPRSICASEDISEEDIGAGFKASIMDVNNRIEDALRQVQTIIAWDDGDEQPEEIVERILNEKTLEEGELGKLIPIVEGLEATINSIEQQLKNMRHVCQFIRNELREHG